MEKRKTIRCHVEKCSDEKRDTGGKSPEQKAADSGWMYDPCNDQWTCAYHLRELRLHIARRLARRSKSKADAYRRKYALL